MWKLSFNFDLGSVISEEAEAGSVRMIGLNRACDEVARLRVERRLLGPEKSQLC